VLPLLRISVADLLQLVLYIFMFSIIIEVVLSWVNPGAYNPLTVILYRLNRPLLDPARRLMPPLGGLDFSPFLVLVALQLINILLIRPLFGAAAGLGFF
jgi:YggT family protein